MMELKPCPFCGYRAVVEEMAVRKGYEAVVQCLGCMAFMGSVVYETDSEAINAVTEAWNRRAT